MIEPSGVSVDREVRGRRWLVPSGQPFAEAMLTVGMSVVFGGGMVGLGPIPA
jgi:hypothetical protein